VVVEQPQLGVPVQVAVVDVRTVIRTHVEYPSPGLGNATNDPPLLNSDAAGWRALQQHRDRNPLPRLLGQDVTERRILKGVAGKANAAPCRAQVRSQRIEGVIGRHEHLQIGLFVAGRGQEEAVQLPAGVTHPASLENISGILRPIGDRVGVRDGQSGELVELPVEDLALLVEGRGGRVRRHARPAPSAGSLVAFFVEQHIAHLSAGPAQD